MNLQDKLNGIDKAIDGCYQTIRDLKRERKAVIAEARNLAITPRQKWLALPAEQRNVFRKDLKMLNGEPPFNAANPCYADGYFYNSIKDRARRAGLTIEQVEQFCSRKRKKRAA
jgi:hypothetical protein